MLVLPQEKLRHANKSVERHLYRPPEHLHPPTHLISKGPAFILNLPPECRHPALQLQDMILLHPHLVVQLLSEIIKMLHVLKHLFPRIKFHYVGSITFYLHLHYYHIPTFKGESILLKSSHHTTILFS